MCGSMADIQSAAAEIRRGKKETKKKERRKKEERKKKERRKKEERKKKEETRGQKYNILPYSIGQP